MDTQTSLIVSQLTCCLGFALWLGFALINNLRTFTNSVGAIGVTMSMAPLAQPPVIDTPLLARVMRSPLMHHLALSIIVALQVATVVAAWADCYELLFGADLETARPRFSLALNAALDFLFGMLLGGLQFGYWICQGGLQLTHLLLVVWVPADFFMLDVRWS